MFYEDITLEDCYNNSDVCDFICDGDYKCVEIIYKSRKGDK